MPGRDAATASEKAARGERAGPVGLDEHIGLAHQVAQHLRLRAQIESRRALADAGIELDETGVRKMGRADLEDIGAMLGKALAAGRTGEHPREVEHPHAAERARRAPGLRRRIADASDLDKRLRGDRRRLRVPAPLLLASHVAGASARRVDGVLESHAVPRAACRSARSRSAGVSSTRIAASRWLGKLQWMLTHPSRTG